MSPSPTATEALETLRALGFRLDTTTGSYRLIRQFDSSQAALYSTAGTAEASLYTTGFGINSGNLGSACI